MGNVLTRSRYWEVNDSSTMWHGFKYGIPGLYSSYDTDFHRWTADSWTVTEVETTGTVTETLLDVANGVLRLTTGSTENDGVQIQLGGTGDAETTGEGFAPVAGKNIYFETSFRTDDATQNDFFFGLHVQDTSIIAGRGADYIGFRKDDGDALLDVECANTSTASEALSVTTIGASTFYKIGFKVTGTTSIDFWLNDQLVRSITTNIPTALMKLSFGILTGDGSANQLDLDYARIYQEV